MAVSTSAAATLCLSSSSRTTPTSSSSPSTSAVVVSFASSSSLFFSDNTINRAGFGLVVKARKGIKYGYNDKSSRRRGLSCNCLFGLGVPELVVIAGVVAIVFGPKKLPEVGRSFGKTIKGFQQAAKEFESELKKDPEAAGEQSTAENVIAETGDEKQKVVSVGGEERQESSVSTPKES